MKITLRLHGGIAAGVRRAPSVVDTTRLPEGPASELSSLLAAAQATQVAHSGAPGRARDAISYSIEIEDNGVMTVLRETDATLSEPFARLVTWIGQHADN